MQDHSLRDEALDVELLQRIADRRDVAAMEQLYLRFRPRLVRFLNRLSKDDGLIEEAYNDVMIKVWDKAGQYQGRSKVSSWIFSIAYRTCLRMVQKQAARNSVFNLMGDEIADLEVDAPKPSEHSAHGSELGDERLAAAVASLSSKHRLVVELCYFEGYSLNEISTIVGRPVNTIKTRLHHARKKLKQALEVTAEA